MVWVAIILGVSVLGIIGFCLLRSAANREARWSEIDPC